MLSENKIYDETKVKHAKLLSDINKNVEPHDVKYTNEINSLTNSINKAHNEIDENKLKPEQCIC